MTDRDPARVLILSAPIGEGHDLPARFLAEGLKQERPGTEVTIADGLAVMGPFVERVIHSGSRYESRLDNVTFDALYLLITYFPPARWLVGTLGGLLGGRRLLTLMARTRADVVVSTYPGFVEVLGRYRLRGRMKRPLASAITDLSALRYWSHPGCDLHLMTHPESEEEVRSIAGPRPQVVTVRGLNDPRFAEPRDRGDARRALDLPEEPPIVVVSGGGWGVGDLAGAVDEALSVPGTYVVALEGRSESARDRLETRYANGPNADRVRVMGFTTEIPDLFAAADVLIHSTAGLTVLEAHVRGCRPISYGWGLGHIRANNRAYRRFGIATVAASRSELRRELQRALDDPAQPDASFAQLPSAASVVLGLVDERRHRS